MHAESIREALAKTPREPFTIHLVSGKSYTLDHPDYAWLTRGGRSLLLNLPEGEGERVVTVDTALIEQIEPLAAGASA